jgi:hypothetical protein
MAPIELWTPAVALGERHHVPALQQPDWTGLVIVGHGRRLVEAISDRRGALVLVLSRPALIEQEPDQGAQPKFPLDVVLNDDGQHPDHLALDLLRGR